MSRQEAPSSERPTATTATRWPAILTIAAGVIMLDGAVLTAAHRSSSPPVSHDKFSSPWHDATAVATSAMWGLAQAFLLVGLVAFARHASRWTPRASLAPLALGGWMIAMLPLQFTAALVVAVGIYAIAVIALGVTLDRVAADGQ